MNQLWVNTCFMIYLDLHAAYLKKNTKKYLFSQNYLWILFGLQNTKKYYLNNLVYTKEN